MKQFFVVLSTFCLFNIYSCNTVTPKETSTEKATDSAKTNENPYVNMDQSPMDMSWCPANYPVEKMKGNDSLKLIAKLIYSRPHKKDRQLFGDSKESLCMYGNPWRLGANEATEIEFFENVNIDGKNIDKGRYVLYCIPYTDRWTIILNSHLNTWGLHINETKDIFKADIPVLKQTPSLEDFTMVFENTESGANLVMAWDNVRTVLPIIFSKTLL
jgi:hypothetical protein